MKDTWMFQANLMRRLRTWALANLFGGGVLLLLRGQPFWQGFGSQAVGWGFVNGLLAVFGGRAAENRRAALANPHDPQIHARENQNLRRILWINAVLDVFYMLGGLMLVQREQNHPQRRGMGWGIVFQGAFLLGFDVLNAIACPHPNPLPKGEGILRGGFLPKGEGIEGISLLPKGEGIEGISLLPKGEGIDGGGFLPKGEGIEGGGFLPKGEGIEWISLLPKGEGRGEGLA